MNLALSFKSRIVYLVLCAAAVAIAGLIMAYVSFIIVHGELVGNVLLI